MFKSFCNTFQAGLHAIDLLREDTPTTGREKGNIAFLMASAFTATYAAMLLIQFGLGMGFTKVYTYRGADITCVGTTECDYYVNRGAEYVKASLNLGQPMTNALGLALGIVGIATALVAIDTLSRRRASASR